MAWFALARVFIVAAVAYTAAVLQPLPVGLPGNIAFALVLAGLVVVLESRLRARGTARVLGALLGCTVGLADCPRDRGGALLGRSSRRPGGVPPQLPPLVLPYLGLVLGARHGEWLEPARLVSLFRSVGPRAALQDSRHERHHRRPDRRRLRDRLHRRHARHPAVRAEGAAARGRFLRLAEAQPRPARPRHPAEDPEDGRRRSDDLRRRLPGGPRSRSQADRAGADAAGEDRHERLQPEQGRPAARRRRPQRQRAGQRAQAGRAPRAR